MRIDLSAAIQSLAPNALWTIESDTTVIWEDVDNVQPTMAALEAEVTRLQAVYDSQAYSRSRATAYAALNQDEMRYDDLTNSTTTWIDAINAIKQEFPK